MSLTLTIENVERLDNGEPTQLRLDRHGAVIGRSPHSDWSLPDPKNYVSSTHCEIDYRDGGYLLIDKSTNGTFLNGSTQRLSGPQPLKEGDVITIGHYRVAVGGAGAAGAPASSPSPGSAAPAAGPSADAWGWDSKPGGPAAAPAPSAGWNSAASGWDAGDKPRVWSDDPSPDAPAEAGWGAAPAEPGGAPSGWGATADPSAASPGWGDTPAPPGWESAPAPGRDWSPSPGAPPVSGPRSGWSAAAEWAPDGMDRAARPPASGWDALAPARDAAALATPEGRVAGSTAPVSGRGMMAQNWAPPRVDAPAPPAPAPAAVEDVWGRMAASNVVDWSRGGFGEPGAAPATAPAAPAPPPAAAAPPAARPADGAAWGAFLAAAGIPPGVLKSDPASAAATAGDLMKRLVSGLVVMMEARARAKAQLGSQSTTLELRGNNPIKFARSPERVLAQLLDPAERGFMGATDAVEDSFRDLQAHQMATLAAMQGALRSTLDRFSPDAIRKRAEKGGFLAKILPGGRDATLWAAYEREFEGVAKGSDEAFMDVFAKAFKAAYEQASAQMKSQGR